MSDTKIMPCTCDHPAQDRLHGPGRRVHNYGPKAARDGGWRCTVCGSEKAGSAGKAEKKEVPT